jgi:hypothetical protein
LAARQQRPERGRLTLLAQIFLDYTSKDSTRPDAFSELPAREEFYAYIGLTPFLALALLPLAWWKKPRRPLIFFALLLLLAAGWISTEHMPWARLFVGARLFVQFRHLLRILLFGSFALIALAGLGLDTLWKLFEEAAAPKSRAGFAYAGLLLLSAFMLLGVSDVFATNQKIIFTHDFYQPAYVVAGWLRQRIDAGAAQSGYYVRHNPNNAWTDAYISSGLRFIENWYHFADIRDLNNVFNRRPVQAAPHYIVQSQAEPFPAGGQFLANVDGYDIFSMPQALPMAFSVADRIGAPL